jgi:type I restriction enzyme S subunit
MSWQKVKLCDICEIIAGQSPESKYYNKIGEGVPFFQGKADFSLDYPVVRSHTTKITKLAQPLDVLLSVRAPVGPTNICHITCCIGRGLVAIRCGYQINYKFLRYFFKTIEKKLSASGNGSTFEAITTQYVKEIEIPLPPLDVQKKIADILDKADGLRRKDAELIKKYDELAQSIFIDMFGDPVTNNKSWEKLPIHKIGTVKTGNTPSRANKKFYGNHVEWIKTDNIKMDSIYPASASEYLSQDGLNVGRYVEQDSILVTCIAGSANTIGNIVLTDRKVAFNQQINSLTPNENHEPLFIYFLFRNIKKYIQLSTTEGMKRIITKSTFENLELISPPLGLQRLFCNRIQKYVDSKKMLNNIYSEQLFQSLLQRAFNGELVH